MTARRVGATPRALVAFAVLVLLAGCAAPAAPRRSSPSPSASPTPSAAPTAAANRARVVIDGKSVQVYEEDGSVGLDLAYTLDAVAARQRLDEAIGAAARPGTVTTDPCYPQLDEFSWGGLHLFTSPSGLARPGGAQFYVQADGPQAADGLPIQLPSGQSVGATRGQVLGANTGAPSFSDGASIDLHYDIVQGSAEGDPGQYFGALARIVAGRLALIDAPIYYSRPC
ncbi:MAG: hypothetical protein HY996_12720 [Micrococcales bacterium]|nr:hypothetical protein [Micrococcales bacterium]